MHLQEEMNLTESIRAELRDKDFSAKKELLITFRKKEATVSRVEGGWTYFLLPSFLQIIYYIVPAELRTQCQEL